MENITGITTLSANQLEQIAGGNPVAVFFILYSVFGPATALGVATGVNDALTLKQR